LEGFGDEIVQRKTTVPWGKDMLEEDKEFDLPGKF